MVKQQYDGCVEYDGRGVFRTPTIWVSLNFDLRMTESPLIAGLSSSSKSSRGGTWARRLQRLDLKEPAPNPTT